MENDALNLILNRLNVVDTILTRLDAMEASLTRLDAMEASLTRLDAMEASLTRLDAMKASLTRLDAMEASLIQLQNTQDEMKDDIKTIKKNVKDLRDDVDTVYTVQQEDHKTLIKNTDLLNVHTGKLNTLISIANNNQDEHTDFDKRISKLELLIS